MKKEKKPEAISLKKRILLACLLCAIIPTFLSILLFTNVFSSTLNNSTTLDILDTLGIIYDELSLTVKEYSDISLKIADSSTIKKSLHDKNIQGNQQFVELYNLSQGLRAEASFIVFNTNGDYLYGTSGSYKPPQLPVNLGVLRKTKEASGKMISYVIPRRIEREIDISIQFGRAIFDKGRLAGFIIINLSNSSLERLIDPYVSPGSNILVTNKFDEILYISPSFNDYESYLSHDYDESMVYFTEDDNFLYGHKDMWGEFAIIYVHPSGFTNAIKSAIKATSLLIVLTSIPIIFFLATKLSKQVVRPLVEVAEGMEAVSKGNYSMTLPSSRYTELDIMAKYYNKMATEIDYYTALLKKQKKELDEVRVAQLQAQFNPHFVYNTLDTIKWLAREHGIKEISQTTENLSILLRTSINQNQIIELRNEIKILSSYIEIQKIRFDNRFTYEINIADRHMDILLPKLILQSLVENAITHGFSDGSSGIIAVRGYEKAEDFFLEVVDNGVGISAETMAFLLKGTDFDSGTGEIAHHTGLYNANHIIKTYYGENYGLTIDSTSGIGTAIIIKIKKERDIENVENPSS